MLPRQLTTPVSAFCFAPQVNCPPHLQYLHPRRADTEHLSEMVFGTVDLSEKSSGYKVHPIDDEKTLWSKLFYARKDDVLTAGGGSKKALNCNLSARQVGRSLLLLILTLPRG